MQINASTYETLFLLYIDNELSPKERLQVEAWIADNPAYALLMKELKATVVAPETMQFALKEHLKKQEAEVSSEEIEKDLSENWNQEYTAILTEEMQSIPGLTAPFKNSLKKETPSKGIVLRPFSFNQHKFTYTAVAAMLMLFVGYKQLTNTTQPKTLAAITTNTNTASENTIVPTAIKKDAALLPETKASQQPTVVVLAQVIEPANVIASNSNTLVNQPILVVETEAKYEPTEANASSNNTSLLSDKIINESTNASISSIDSDDAFVKDANLPISYEVIDTEDPNRSIYIANFEIDGNRLRGLKRKMNSLFKNNKSDRNK